MAEKKVSPGALRAAKRMAVSPKVRQLALGLILREEFSQQLAEFIDQETAAQVLLDAVKTAQAFFYNPTSFNPLAVEQLYAAAIRQAEGGSNVVKQSAEVRS